MKFDSKNGPMELSMANMSYALETLFWNAGRTFRRVYEATEVDDFNHVFMNLLGSKISEDNYITALCLNLMLDHSEVTIPLKFEGNIFKIGPNTVADLKANLVKIPEFAIYAGVDLGQLQQYDSMSTFHKINAVNRRIAVMNFWYLSYKEHIPLLNDMFNMPVFCALDPEINKIFEYLKEHA